MINVNSITSSLIPSLHTLRKHVESLSSSQSSQVLGKERIEYYGFKCIISSKDPFLKAFQSEADVCGLQKRRILSRVALTRLQREVIHACKSRRSNLLELHHE